MRRCPNLVLFFVIFLAFTLPRCGGLAGISTTGSDADSGGTDSSDDGSSVATDPLSDAESGLYDDGPMDLPVTIAKLDSGNLTAENDAYYTDGTDLSESSGGLYSVRHAETSSSAGYRFEFGENFIKEADRDVVEYLAAVNLETGEIQLQGVNDDGSVDAFTVPAEEGQYIALAPMVADQSAVGIPIYPFVEDGVYGNALTNSTSLSVNLPVQIKDDYTFFSEEFDDATFALYRRNLDGSPVETIISGVTSQIRYVEPGLGGGVAYYTQDGKAYYVKALGTTPETWGSPTLVRDLGAELSPPNSFVPAPVKLATSTNGYIFALNKAVVNENGGDMSTMLAIYNTADGTTSVHMAVTDFKDASFDMGEQDTLFVFLSPYDSKTMDGFGAYELYRLDMTLGHAAWENREKIYAIPGSNDHVATMTASSENVVVFATFNTLSPERTGVLALEDIEHPLPRVLFESPIGVKMYSEHVAVSPSGSFFDAVVLTCANDPETDTSYLVIHNMSDERNVLYRITSPEKETCGGGYNIDDENRIVYFQDIADLSDSDGDGDTDEGYPQLTVTDLNKIDPELIVLEE